MTLPQRLLHTMTDPRARCGYHHLCAILRAAAPSGPGDGRSGAHRLGTSNQNRTAAGPRPSAPASLRHQTHLPATPFPHKTD